MRKSRKTLPKLYFHDHIMKFLVLPFVPNILKPNHFTIFRLMLTPVVIWLLIIKNYIYGLPLFFITAFTDMIDGSLARVRNKITTWGTFFDPVADKLLIGSVAIVLGTAYYPLWLVIFSLGLDVMPSVIWFLNRGKRRLMSANVWGKTKMILQSASFFLLLLGVAMGYPELIGVGQVALIVSLAFASMAVVTYSL